MAYLEWTDELCVNIGEIDRQHRQLVDLINGLHDAMSSGRGKEVLSTTIEGLITYTVSHFATEEQYFERYSYLGALAHEQQHRTFVERVNDFKQGFDEDRLMLSLDVMDFLCEWLVDHIQGSDRHYATHLRAAGVS